MKKIISLVLIFAITLLPVCAKDKIKVLANMNSEFSAEKVYTEVDFINQEEIKLEDELIIPEYSAITGEIYHSQKEKRWHKSAYFICKLKSYEANEKKIDISNKDFYLIARKYEKVNGKDAAITGTELALSTAVAIFLPGVDILYFFTKGAIQREKHANWFRAGVSNAYDNSICWFWLKGKPIELSMGDYILLKDIKKKKAEKIKNKFLKKQKRIEKDLNKKEK